MTGQHKSGAAPGVTVVRANYQDRAHAAALVAMLDAYARDPAGGGVGLSDYAREHLVAELASRPTAFSVLAFDGAQVVGLTNCIEGFSSFACRPLVNVHDLAVAASHRGRRIGEQMLALVEQTGPACHTNRRSCFFTAVRDGIEVEILQPVHGGQS